MTSIHYYDSQGNNITPAEAMRLFASNSERTVKVDVLEHFRVSTVHLVLDHQMGLGPPLIFETMIFNDGGPDPDGLDNWQDRYTDLEQARRGHDAAVQLVRISLIAQGLYKPGVKYIGSTS